MEKIILLGGSYGQIPAINEAKRRGLFTILCDYLPDNPGREIADEYHNVSTTDAEAVLELSREKEIDYIFAYMSDPAVLTAACVAKKLGLRGNPPESIRILSYKDRFRNFMREHGFNVPRFITISRSEIDCEDADLKRLRFPVIVKPVDSSDTKGVYLVNNRHEFYHFAQLSLSFSRCDKIIAEEYVDCETANFHGDAFVVDGEMNFCMLGENLFFSDSNPLKPSSEFYPSRKSKDLIHAVEKEVGRVIQLSGYRNGPVNIEVRVNSNNEIFVMEIGPRSGEGFTPQAVYHSTGFNMLKASFDYLQDKEISIPKNNVIYPVISFVLHTNIVGTLEEIVFDRRIQKYIAEKHLHSSPGDFVTSFHHPNSNLGVIIFKFNNFKEMDALIGDLYNRMMEGIKVKN